ncbi:MAG: penicillin-binding transpeptidase domain-containing protein [Oligoflexia bacterium]|nr:penicillin-binding transpeptidase domain-containing protein [Oligoflexia bacterium]
MKSRIVLLVIAFLGLFSLLVARAFYLQLLPQENLERLRKNQYTTVVTLPPQRGKILDRNGVDLATSITSQSLYADPTLIEKPKRLAKKLAPLIGMSVREVYEKLIAPKRFIWLKRQLTPDTALIVKQLNEPGLRFVEEGKRAYPNQNLLAPVLGIVGSDGDGLEGLEKKYDLELKGEKRSVRSRRDARGRPLVVDGQLFELSGDGATIETTIDLELQYTLERELEEVVRKQEAIKATGIIMDPATGEVLAMGTYPETRRNNAVTDIFEPGSTFKIVTIAAALKTGKIQPNTKYFCENGKFKIGKRTIHESETDHKYEWLSLAEILEVSSNIGTAKVALDIGQAALKNTLHSFGFLTKSGIDFSGEASGMAEQGTWSDHLLTNISFGHGIGVSALQMANAYSAIANGGKLLRPYLVKRVIDSENNVVEQRKTEIVREVLTTKEASTLAMMLTGVTERGGTGMLARVDGYPVAGKTGTAQKVNPNGRGYLAKSYISSFAGFVPANNPQFTIYIMVDNPQHQFYGAQVVAPIFNRIASYALHKKGYMPIVVNENSVTKPVSVNAAVTKVDGMIAENNKMARMPVKAQWSIGQPLNATEDEVIPDFTGLTVREVSQYLEKRSERIKTAQLNPSKREPEVLFLGTGVVQSQFPEPGVSWERYQQIKFQFKQSK